MATTEVRATGNDEPRAARRPPGGRGRRRWVLGILAFVVLAAAVGIATGNEVQANTRFDRAHRTLDGVRSRTVAVDRDLVTARADLTTLDGQVTQDSAVLATDTSRLDTALVALTESREDDANQTTAITNLQTCLGGVEKALNALSVGDQPSAVAALEAVATPCSSAVTASA